MNEQNWSFKENFCIKILYQVFVSKFCYELFNTTLATILGYKIRLPTFATQATWATLSTRDS